MARILTDTLLSSKATTGAGSTFRPAGTERTFQCFGTTSSGAGSATVLVQISNDGTNFEDLGTFTLTLDTTVVAAGGSGFTSEKPWVYVRGYVSAISGTGAAITLIMSHLEVA